MIMEKGSWLYFSEDVQILRGISPENLGKALENLKKATGFFTPFLSRSSEIFQFESGVLYSGQDHTFKSGSGPNSGSDPITWHTKKTYFLCVYTVGMAHGYNTVPEFIDPVFTKTSPKRSFSLNRKRAFWLVFAKTGSIISGTGIYLRKCFL